MKRDTRKIKLEGMRFDRLLVISYDQNESKYNCKCDCGNTKKIPGGDLRAGKIKSCGCMNKERELDIVGQTFNRLTVIERMGTRNKRYLFRCICECGNEKIAEGREIKGGKIKSCGCGIIKGVKEANTTHGLTKTRLYGILRSMKERCFNPNATSYENYGGRGIKIFEEWLGKNGFLNFREWSLNNGYSDDLTIDRIDNNGNYEPSNCRWATIEEQNNNKRTNVFFTYENKTKNLQEWCKEFSLSYDAVWKRINKYDYSFEKAVTYKIDRIKVKHTVN